VRKQLTEHQLEAFRARLIAAAEKLFAAHGVNGITMREIARAVGYSQTAAYRYFANKEEIVAAVRTAALNRFCHRLEAAFNGASGARARSRAVGQAYLKFAEDEPDAYRLIFNSNFLTTASSDFTQALDRLFGTMTGYVKDLIAEGQIEGDAFELGKAFQTATHGVVMMHLGGVFPTIDARDALHRSTMRLIYRGAKPQAISRKEQPRKKVSATGKARKKIPSKT
jgi:AcrR family transcriptional regulator